MSRLAIRLSAALSCALILNGCGLWSKEETVSTEKMSPLPELRSIRVASTINWQYGIGESNRYTLHPARVLNDVFVASEKGELARLDYETGRVKWRIQLPTSLSAGVGIAEEMILVGNTKGVLFAYDFSGKKLWESQLSSEILSLPQLDEIENRLIVRTGDNTIHALNPKTGQREWVYQRAGLPALAIRSDAGVLVTRGGVFVGFPGGKIVALNSKDGAIGWEGVVAQPKGQSEVERIADITSEPVYADGQVCAVAYQGRLSCFEIQNGRSTWSRDISSLTGLISDNRALYVSDENGTIWALDKNNGSTLWKQNRLRFRDLTMPLSQGQYVVVGDKQGYLHWLNKEDGSLVGRTGTDGSPVLNALTSQVNTEFLAQTRAGRLYHVNSTTQ